MIRHLKPFLVLHLGIQLRHRHLLLCFPLSLSSLPVAYPPPPPPFHSLSLFLFLSLMLSASTTPTLSSSLPQSTPDPSILHHSLSPTSPKPSQAKPPPSAVSPPSPPSLPSPFPLLPKVAQESDTRRLTRPSRPSLKKKFPKERTLPSLNTTESDIKIMEMIWGNKQQLQTSGVCLFCGFYPSLTKKTTVTPTFVRSSLCN